MKVVITNKTRAQINTRAIKKLVQRAVDKLKVATLVSIAFVSDSEIRKLNKIYRGRDKVTDVLSFAYNEAQFLGEVIICYPEALRQARKLRVSFSQEIKFLIFHGLLHLLGYEHETIKGRKLMERLEAELGEQI